MNNNNTIIKPMWVVQRLDTKEFFCGQPSYLRLNSKHQWTTTNKRPHIFTTDPSRYIKSEFEDTIIIRRLVLEDWILKEANNVK